jgi:hypothetical protein
LQRQQRPVLQRLDRDPIADPVAQMRDIGRFAGRVDDQEQPVREARRHQIVQNAARLVEEERVAQPHRAEPGNVAGHQRFERRRRRGPAEPQLPHMRHVEQPGLRPGMQMLGENPGPVLQRHRVAGERHHAGAECAMQRIERRVPQRRRSAGLDGILSGHSGASDRERTRLRPLCPLCRGP